MIDAVTWSRRGRTLLLALLTLLLAGETLLSLQWSMQHNTPLLWYIGYLIAEHGFVPYADVYETSMPGSFLLHATLGRIVGWSDLAFRLVDLTWLTAMLAVAWTIMRPFGRPVAWLAAVLFGLTYLRPGGSMSFERDAVAVLPIALAVLAATRPTGAGGLAWLAWLGRMGPRGRALLVGAGYGAAVSIKPHLALGAPVVVAFLVVQGGWPGWGRAMRDLVLLGLLSLTTFFAVVAIPFAWLAWTGGFDAFWWGFREYLPLHLQMNGEHVTVTTGERLVYALSKYAEFGDMGLLLVPASVGLMLATGAGGMIPGAAPLAAPQRRVAGLLACLVLVMSVHPVLSGQFWTYHWMPFGWAASLCAGLLLLPVRAAGRDAAGDGASDAASADASLDAGVDACMNAGAGRPADQHDRAPVARHVFPVALLAFTIVIAVRPPQDVIVQLRTGAPAPIKTDRHLEIEAFLREHLEPGDTVQPLDWTGGAVHGMLRAEAVLATPFLCDYHFHHHVSQPPVQAMRQRMLDAFAEAQPRFVIDVAKTLRPSGRDTSPDFPELDAVIARDYVEVQVGNGYRILERRAEP